MKRIFLISSGQLQTKKDKNAVNKKNLYLNYGLLSLATVLKRSGYNPIVIHGNFSKPENFISELKELGILETQHPIYISLPSYYALSWAKEIIFLLKNAIKNKIYVGGRWVINGHPEKLKLELPLADEIIDGLAENKIIETISGVADKNNYSHLPLDYSLLINRELYQPSIEISRGCGKGCNFCQEGNIAMGPMKPPKIIINELHEIFLSDNLREMTPYFEASIFKPNEAWLEQLINEQKNADLHFKWRSESRVDALSKKIVPLLSQAGMEVIDLGLESGSPNQLLSMGKTKKPDHYLTKASDLLKECHAHGIKTKINVMLYAGESNTTLEETNSWLNEHKDYIYGLSCGIVSAFGWSCNQKPFIQELLNKGATICKEHSFTGITNFNLSNEINYLQGMEEAKKISRTFMSMNNFFYLKAFSYYPRNYSFENFKKDIYEEKGIYSFEYIL
jgi:radical SAM superfamily enzyme YgiQ (UPF0313 family)